MPRKKWKFNIIDIIALVLIAAVVFFVAVKLLDVGGGDRETVSLTYKVVAEDQPVEMYEAVLEYLPSRVMASGVLCDAEITAVEAKPTLVCSGGEWVESPNYADLIFTVTTRVAKEDAESPTVAAQEIRIGNKITLNAQYIKFDPVYVVSVEYGQ